MPSISTSFEPGMALRGRAAAGLAHELVLGAVDDGHRHPQLRELRAAVAVGDDRRELAQRALGSCPRS